MSASAIHTMTITTEDGERTYRFGCPDDCPTPDECEPVRQLSHRILELADDLPEGEYRFWAHTLWTYDTTITLTLPSGEIVPALTGAPSGCQHCGIPEREHGRQHMREIGWHSWHPPTTAQIKLRMRARRNKEAR